MNLLVETEDGIRPWNPFQISKKSQYIDFKYLKRVAKVILDRLKKSDKSDKSDFRQDITQEDDGLKTAVFKKNRAKPKKCLSTPKNQNRHKK